MSTTPLPYLFCELTLSLPQGREVKKCATITGKNNPTNSYNHLMVEQSVPAGLKVILRAGGNHPSSVDKSLKKSVFEYR